MNCCCRRYAPARDGRWRWRRAACCMISNAISTWRTPRGSARLRIALTPALMLTTGCIRSARPISPGSALRGADATGPQRSTCWSARCREYWPYQSDGARRPDAEDAFLNGHYPPTARDLIGIRRRVGATHRLLAGMRASSTGWSRIPDLPETLLAHGGRLVQRLHALDADIARCRAQLRLLREELDLQAAQRTNQNLYILSIISALLLPATLVTGIFGMNTGGLPFAAQIRNTPMAAHAGRRRLPP
jgi:zinc transporter